VGTQFVTDISEPTRWLLRVQCVSKSFGGTEVLRGVSFDLHHGEVVGLVGANGSGKSTLVKIITGFLASDGDGQVELSTPQGGTKSPRVGVVHQELGLIGSLSIAENLFLGTPESVGSWWWSERNLKQLAGQVLREHGLDVRPEVRVDDIPRVLQVQIAVVRAAMALQGHESNGALVLDEATAALDARDRQDVYRLTAEISAQGGSVLLVSHDLEEVLNTCRRILVLRDGTLVNAVESKGVNRASLMDLMFGKQGSLERRIGKVNAPRQVKTDTAHPETGEHFVRGARSRPDGLDTAGQAVGPRIALSVNDVILNRSEDAGPASWWVQHGEVLGLAGLPGSGAAETLAAIVGARPAFRGSLALSQGHYELSEMSPKRALRLGIHFVPGDRLRDGAAGGLAVWENVMLPFFSRRQRWAMVPRRAQGQATRVLADFQVVPLNAVLEFHALSGGNQQKTLIAKWMHRSPSVLLLDEPTVGVDVRSRQYIWELIRYGASQGMGVVVFSADHEELAALCDRVLVYVAGRIEDEHQRPHLTKDAIARSCFEASATPGRV
jgi:ribose transport system ATP-binding protein